jgi:zinc protease
VAWPTDLDARYELLDEAGRGGMGVVYRARDRETGELVAIKVLKPEIAADRASAERFINEVRLSRRITHKNVCRVYEFTRVGSTAYLSMEFVEGESLRSILSRMGSVNLRKGIQIARQICAALAEAHAQGIVHRDLKPENVMLDKSGNVKVMDFGIARLLDSAATATVGVMGTPAYMAPEQAESRTVDGRTDIYALGLILYELFTGQTAFSGETPVAIALKQIRETPAAPRTIDASIPADIDAIVMRCLQKDPAQRYQTVEELDAALAAVPIQQGTGTLPALTPSPRALLLPGRRAAMLAALAIVLTVGIAAFLKLWRTDEEIPFTAFTLQNGLQVVVAEDHSAPTVAVVVTYTVGSRDERAGRRGFAHLFEHMMFAGSLNVGKGEHLALVSNYGGVPNGQAAYDTTQFWQTLPANQLDLALFLEADRMRSLKLEDVRLESERATVVAEIVHRKENGPYGGAQDALFALAYDTSAYKRDVLGSPADIRAATLAEVADFFKIYYAPNNAVLTIVGDVQTNDARARVEKYFQHIPAQPPPPAPDLSEPSQTGERRGRLEDRLAPAPRLYIAYKGPAGASADWEPLQLLTAILGGGASSRLYQKVVRESGSATNVGGFVDRRTGPGLATFVLAPSANRDADAVLAQFNEVVNEIGERGVNDVELTRAKRRLSLARANSLQATRDRAMLLGEYQSMYGDASAINARSAQLATVTADDVRRVAREYFTRERRTILEVVPTPSATRIPGTQPSTSAVVRAPMERLNRAPVSKDLLRVSLPEPHDFTLENGLGVQIAEMARVPLVTVRLDIRGAGPMNDPPDQPGLALMTAVMLREGTANRSSRDISDQFDLLGAAFTVGTFSDPGSIVVTVTGLPDTFDQWFPLAAEVVMHPSFPADELTRAKRTFGAEIATRRSTATAAASDLFVMAAGVSRVPVVATPQMLAGVNGERLAAWHRERYVPQNAVLSIAGAVDSERVETVVRSALSAWPRTAFTETPPVVQRPAQRAAHVMERPGSVQNTLLLGGPATNRADADHLSMVVANVVLGSGPSSRLFTKLREQTGASFNAQSGLTTYRHGGYWLVYGDTSAARTGDALKGFLDEVQRLSTEPIPAQELDDAKRSIIGRFALTLEAQSQIAIYMGYRRTEGLSADYWARYPDMLQAVTADDIRRAAARHMDISKVQIVAVGSRDQLGPLLAPFGPVTVYDADGRPLPHR